MSTTVKKSVIKRAAAISFSGQLSNVARRIYNIMLARAYDGLAENRAFKTPTKTVFGALGMPDCRNWDYLKKVLRELTVAELKHDALGIDGSGEWYSDKLIQASEVKDGMVEWEYSQKMQKLLRDAKETDGVENPVAPYVVANLLIHNNFTKHGLTLYELCLHWLPPKAREGSSGFFSLTDIRTLFGVKYPDFGQLNREVLKNAINSVNDKENKAPLKVKMIKVKEGRSVIGVKFTITRRSIKKDKVLVADLPGKNPFRKEASQPEPKKEKKKQQQEKLGEEASMSKSKKEKEQQQEKLGEEAYATYLALEKDMQTIYWTQFENENRLSMQDDNEVWDGLNLKPDHPKIKKSFKFFLSKRLSAESIQKRSDTGCQKKSQGEKKQSKTDEAYATYLALEKDTQTIYWTQFQIENRLSMQDDNKVWDGLNLTLDHPKIKRSFELFLSKRLPVKSSQRRSDTGCQKKSQSVSEKDFPDLSAESQSTSHYADHCYLN